MTKRAFRPRTYWPRGRSKAAETEIVRISVASQTRDVITLRARCTAAGRIVYRMIHEDATGRTGQRLRLKRASSARPLSFAELVDLLETACYAAPCSEPGDDDRYGGVIWGTLRINLDHGTQHADDYAFFLSVTSQYYPQLERYYAERVAEWCLANCVEAEDCRKVVRLRTGCFPRKLVEL